MAAHNFVTLIPSLSLTGRKRVRSVCLGGRPSQARRWAPAAAVVARCLWSSSFVLLLLLLLLDWTGLDWRDRRGSLQDVVGQ